MAYEEILTMKEYEYNGYQANDFSVAYFVVCKKEQYMIGDKNAYELKIAGERICDWVARACENPKVFEIYDNLSDIEAVMPYVSDTDYVVILSGNVPLLTKQTLKGILRNVVENGINVLKLKCGYVINTAYLKEVGEIFSCQNYGEKLKDFFEVTNFETYNIAKAEITKRMFNFYSKNGVNLESFDIEIDANVQIDRFCTVGKYSQILDGTKILSDSKVGKNVLIEQSLISKNTKIGDGVVLKSCKIGDSCEIGDGCILENCEIESGTKIMAGSKLADTKISENVVIKRFCDIISSNVSKNATVGEMARLFRANIEEDYEVYDGKVIIHRLEDKK